MSDNDFFQHRGRRWSEAEDVLLKHLLKTTTLTHAEIAERISQQTGTALTATSVSSHILHMRRLAGVMPSRVTHSWSPQEHAELQRLLVSASLTDVQIAEHLSKRFGRAFTEFSVKGRIQKIRKDARTQKSTTSPTQKPSTVPLPADEDGMGSVDVDVSDFASSSTPAPVPSPSSPSVSSVSSASSTPVDPPAPPAASAASILPAEEPIALRTAREIEIHRLRERLNEVQIARKRLLDELKDKDQQIGILSDLRQAPPPAPVVAPAGRGEGKQRVGVPVMLLSDWHIEEPVTKESVNGLNEYNLDIAAACIGRCAEAFEWFAHDPRWDCRTAIIWLGGDLFSGYIHAELQESNFLSPVQAVVWLQEHLERMLHTILKTTQFERILVKCNDGNHGRLTDKMRVATRTANSLEWLLYKTLAARFHSEPRLEFEIADGEFLYQDVYDQTLCFFHGDSVRYLGGVGGLLIPMKRGLNEIRKYKKVDHFCFGHFHTRLDLPDMSGNGSMIGINAYSMKIKATPEPRQQSWFLIDSVRGKCLSAPVWLPMTV